MPLYDYSCAGCGDFRAFRPMRESAAPGECPTCGSPCARVLTAPYLADASPQERGATPRNGRIGFGGACGHGHGGCSHSHGA